MPILIVGPPSSSMAASSCAPTTLAGIPTTSLTARLVCTVTAVTTPAPYTPSAASTRRSRKRPAAPVGSVPPMHRTRGGASTSCIPGPYSETSEAEVDGKRFGPPGGTGRRGGLKIRCPQGHPGSSPGGATRKRAPQLLPQRSIVRDNLPHSASFSAELPARAPLRALGYAAPWDPEKARSASSSRCCCLH